MRKPEAADIVVLIGEHGTSVLTEFLQELVDEAVQGDFSIEYVLRGHIAEVVETVAMQRIDLCLLVLNNMLGFPRGLTQPGTSDEVAKLVGTLKREQGVSIIALSGVPELENPARLAGADFYFPLPFDLHEMRAAMRQCLVSRTGTPAD